MERKYHNHASPLRYPGGKGMLANFVKLVLAHNNILDCNYVEVYAGGAAIAWSLLFEEYVRHVHINDLNRSVFAFWHSVIYETEALCRMIQDTPVTMEEWYRQKSVQTRPDEVTQLELGFSTFFLNRTNRSGIINAGVIGGYDQKGPWKLDARYNKRDLISRIKKISRYRSRISIYNQDAAAFIQSTLQTLPQKSLAYFDPPYYNKANLLYENYYKPSDHAHIADLIGKISQPWIVSYDNVAEIHRLYSGYRSIIYDLHYTASLSYLGTEVIFSSNDLEILHQVTNPCKVPRSLIIKHQSFLPFMEHP